MPWNHSGGTTYHLCMRVDAFGVDAFQPPRWPWSAIYGSASISMAMASPLAWYSCTAIGCATWRRLNEKKDADLRLSHEEVRRLAATAERERIGRDLHDLLGHTLSLIALKSELAGKLLARDPVAARREIADVERITREALAQVRSAVSGMRAAGWSANRSAHCSNVRAYVFVYGFCANFRHPGSLPRARVAKQ